MTENEWDKLLKIKTTGRDDSNADQFRYPYEPTPYRVLERLANSGYIGKKNMLIDYGCGKGRVDFFMSYQTRCRAMGIEYDEHIWATAISNEKTAVSAGRVMFCHEDAALYQVPMEADRFYFFNPFSEEILCKVIHRILESYYEENRSMLLFFYYPSDEYISYLMTMPELMFLDEIKCEDLFDAKDTRERIVIFSIG